MQTEQQSRVTFFLKALLPMLLGLLPWLGVQLERPQGGRQLEVTLRPTPIPELAAASSPAPQLPGIQAANPPARMFGLPAFVLQAAVLPRLQEQVLHLSRPLVLYGRLMLDGG